MLSFLIRRSSIPPMVVLLSAAMLAGGGFGQTKASQKPLPPDKLIEAVGYSFRAQEELECGHPETSDPVAEAILYKEKALRTAREFRSTNPTEKEQAATFVARQERELQAWQARRKQLDDAAKAIDKTLKQGRLETADRLIAEANPPKCSARFQALTAALTEARTRAGEYVSAGDKLLAKDPRKAWAQYSDGLVVDKEYPQLKEKLAEADRLAKAHKK